MKINDIDFSESMQKLENMVVNAFDYFKKIDLKNYKGVCMDTLYNL